MISLGRPTKAVCVALHHVDDDEREARPFKQVILTKSNPQTKASGATRGGGFSRSI
jgi:hypothetical protein